MRYVPARRRGVVIVSPARSAEAPEARSALQVPSAFLRWRYRSMPAGSAFVASTTALALSTPSGTVNSAQPLVAAVRTPAPDAPVVTEPSNGACAGPAGGASPGAPSSGTVS